MKTRFKPAGIIGIGSCLPENVLTNSDLEKMVDTSDEWIIKRTGIRERRILDKGQPAYSIGYEAALRAIEDAGISAEDIDLIIVATETPDYLTPSTACILQGKLGARNAAAFDLNAACTGMIYALSVARQYVSSGTYRYVLVVCCEGLSKVTDWQDRKTCVLFGDAAGAVVIGEVEEGYGIIDTYLGSDGEAGRCLTIPCCHMDESDIEKRTHENKRVLWMDGSEVFKFAVRIMEHATEKILDLTGTLPGDLKMIFPHQANVRIIEGALKRLGISDENMMPVIHKYGNISSASIPVSIDEAYRAGRLLKGDKILLVGFGGGLTWGSAIIRWNKNQPGDTGVN